MNKPNHLVISTLVIERVKEQLSSEEQYIVAPLLSGLMSISIGMISIITPEKYAEILRAIADGIDLSRS